MPAVPEPAVPTRTHRCRRRGRRALASLAATAMSVGLLAAVPAAAQAAPAPRATDRAAERTGLRSREDLYVARTMHRMTVEQKIGQMITGYVYGPTATTADPRNTALYGVATPAEVVEKYSLGGVVYFAWTDSFADPQQVAGLSNGLQKAATTSGARVPLLVSTDQEQGVVTRFGPPATAFPGSMALGAGRSTEDARTAARITGSELAAVGINQDFAPVSDVNVNPLNPVIGVRSFSSDPQLAARMVTAQVAGYQQDAGIVSTAKHFPGHGDTATDSHVGLPLITHTREEWERIDAPPFRAAVEAGIDAIMTAHIVVPALDPSGDPATLSEPIMTGMLRDELGYDGVIVTDSLEMAGVRTMYGDGEVAVRAVEAGADVLLMPAQPAVAVQAIEDALASGRLTEARLDESVERILRLKFSRGIAQHPMVDTAAIDDVVGIPAHAQAAQAVTDRTVTALRNDDDLLPLAEGTAHDVLVTGWGVTTTASMGAAMVARGHDVTVTATGAAPSDATIEDAVATAREEDLVVVLTQKAWDTAVTDPQGRQQRLVAELTETGVPVVHVAVRDPYDVAYLPDVTTSLATYSSTPVSMESAARVMHGEVSPAGKLPVDVPVAGDPGTVLYPFGFGLEW